MLAFGNVTSKLKSAYTNLWIGGSMIKHTPGVQKKGEKRPERKDNNSEYSDVIRLTMIAA